jgi:hypothetical protein
MNPLYNRHSKLIYRDMVRLINTVMEEKKRIAVKAMVRKEFERSKLIQEEEEIFKLKKNSVKALSDLYIYYVKSAIKEDQHNPNKDILL